MSDGTAAQRHSFNRGRRALTSLLATIALAAPLIPLTGTAPVYADPSRPAACVPFGTAQLPPGAPSAGDRRGFDRFTRYTGTQAPKRVDLRTERTQFNRFWEFTLLPGGTLLARPRHTDTWRIVPLPGCLRGILTAISLDDDELVGIDKHRWIYTMDQVNQSPLLWNWTSGFGAPLWMGGGQTIPADTLRPTGWALSVTSPSDNREYLDIAGRVHPSGGAKMTMIPTLRGDGSRIAYADPWLPNDRSYEIGSPLGGRFQSVSLSASASTLFVTNRYGDMFTRTFDFDSSGSDSVFFRYSWEPQDGKPSAPSLGDETWGSGYAAVQLPAPDWDRQPKIPGEITSVLTVVSPGPGAENRELRVEGRRNGRTGYWHKHLRAAQWEFTETGTALQGTVLANSPADRSAETLAAPAPWNLSADLPSRDALVDGQTLIDLGLPYSIIDPRLLDQVGLTAAPSGYRLYVKHFDPAVTTREATVVAPGGQRIPVLLHTADGMRMTPSQPGLTATPRHLVGAVALSDEVWTSRTSDPAVKRFVADWMRGKQIAAITLSATKNDLVIR